tara:strand:+ start:75 stop:902 length:828 start_codon:yes stop_codon:yes gene_type:complete
MTKNTYNYNLKKFNIQKRVAVITGGAGFLGKKHVEAIAEIGGTTVIFDKKIRKANIIAREIHKKYNTESLAFKVDVTDEKQIYKVSNLIKKRLGSIDILINNVATNPIVGNKKNKLFQRLEKFKLSDWNADINVGLTSAFLCSKVIGLIMANQKKGVIINISSDLGIIAPDQRIYKNNDLVKPISYSVVKHGLIGLTKYLSTYWADKGVRSNALCPGGVLNNQNPEFVKKISELIPIKRMANEDEYKSAIQFLSSDASSYMNGSSLIIDGGRTAW